MSQAQFARVADKARRIPGSLPPIAERELRSFELEHAIRLPEDYRRFLLEIANGGRGPYYGLLSLEEWEYPGRLPKREELAKEPTLGFLASPCPLQDRLYGENWLHELEPYEWDPYQGTLTLCHQGCTYLALLVVSGEARGRVVNVCMSLQLPVFSPYPDFLSWYEGWQDMFLSDPGSTIMDWYGFPDVDTSNQMANESA
jgi:hypothetical protein